MSYAIQLAGPSSARIWIASTYNPFRIAQVEGIPSQTTLSSKLGWRAGVSATGTFESRSWSRTGAGILATADTSLPSGMNAVSCVREVSIRPRRTMTRLPSGAPTSRPTPLDLRIPWSLLGVTDPSSFKIVAGLERDGTVMTTNTRGLPRPRFPTVRWITRAPGPSWNKATLSATLCPT